VGHDYHQKELEPGAGNEPGHGERSTTGDHGYMGAVVLLITGIGNVPGLRHARTVDERGRRGH
jgi:hypothetical protein